MSMATKPSALYDTFTWPVKKQTVTPARALWAIPAYIVLWFFGRWSVSDDQLDPELRGFSWKVLGELFASMWAGARHLFRWLTFSLVVGAAIALIWLLPARLTIRWFAKK